MEKGIIPATSFRTTENEFEIISDLEMVELNGGKALSISASGINCPTNSGNCVSGCACGTKSAASIE